MKPYLERKLWEKTGEEGGSGGRKQSASYPLPGFDKTPTNTPTLLCSQKQWG